MIIPGFTLQHARSVASCASASVNSHISSNKATPRKGRVVPTLLTSRFSCFILECGFRFGHNSSIFLSMARRTRRGTDFVGWESSTTQLKNNSGMLKKKKTLSLVRLHFLSRHKSKGCNLVLHPLSGLISQKEIHLPVHVSCTCTFRGTVSRRPHWEPCSRRHHRSSPSLQVEHRTRPG